MKKMDLFTGLFQFFNSIRFRLVMWFMIILSIVLASFSIFIYYNQARDIRGDALFRLERKYSEMEDAFLGADRDTRILQPTDVLILIDSHSKVIMSKGVVSNDDILLLLGKSQEVQLQKNSKNESQDIWWVQSWNGGISNYCFMIKDVSISGEKGYVILGSPFDPYGLNSRLLFTLLLGSLVTLIVAFSGGLWLADRAMRPVHTITMAARNISETDLNHRLNLNGKDELSELANTFDEMIARLQAAFERQRQFVADASHELRTPLTIVNLESSRALSAKRTIPEYQRVLEVIRSENEFMSHMVGDLLTLARMDAGQLIFEKKLIDLSDVAVDSIERLQGMAERNGVLLETGELPETNIFGDRQYLIQLISNLIENGIKYTTGEIKKVKIETGESEGAFWLRVSDNGQGISQEHMPKLFTRFYRADQARTRNDDQHASGTGLGLSIVDWIVRAHNGEITVDSEPGKGTCFVVKFPKG